MAIRRLRWVLSLQPLLAIILPFGVVVLLGMLWIQPQIRSDIETRQRQLARAVGMQVESHLHAGAAMVRAAAVVNLKGILPQPEHQRPLNALLETTETISSLYVVAADGKVSDVALKKGDEKHRTDLIGLNLFANPLFRELSQDGKPRWSKTFLSVIHGGLVAAYGVQDDGTTLIGEVDLSFLTKFLQQISTESDLLILIIDQNGQIVADNDGLYTAQQLNIGNIGLVRTGLETKAPSTGQFQFAGRAMIGSISPIRSVDWHILVAKTNSSLYHTVSEIGLIVLVAAIGALAVGILTSIFIARKLASRFDDLSRHAQSIAQGGRSGDWPSSSIDAFSQLSGSLQLMARRLQDSETLYRTLFERLPDGVVLWELPSLTPKQFNTAAHTQLGYTRDEFAELRAEDFHASSSDANIADHQETLKQQGIASFETVYRTKAGESRSMFITLESIELAGQPMVLAIHRDISAWKVAEEEKQNTNELLGMFMQHSPIYTFIKEVTPSESRVLLASENYLQMIGIPGSEMVGKTMSELYPAELSAKMTADDWQVVTDEKVLEIEEEFNGRSYTSIKFPILQGTKTLLAGYTIDITERKHAEEKRLNLERQMLHLQKLESLGLLAGGIAHDFNNILMIITGNADMGLIRIAKGQGPAEHLQRIKQAADTAADLAQQMLAYSGKGTFLVESLDLNQLLEEMLHILQVSISKNVSLQLNLSKQLPAVEADATQMRQIIMNLIINASEAIGKQSGVITVTTNTITCSNTDSQDPWQKEGISSGEYVYLEIADNGCGMNKSTLGKLFDPFFTTKFTGRGLGMSAVQGIVRSHQGAINVSSEPGQGSTFEIRLPASGLPAAPPGIKTSPENWKGQGRVLLVDDEEAVRNIGSEMLTELGFSVVTASDGSDALDTYRTTQGIDLVILDLTMPQMNGEQCLRELRQINPDIKVIMSSGYSELRDAQFLMEQGLVGFIQKPYWMDTLRETIQKASMAV